MGLAFVYFVITVKLLRNSGMRFAVLLLDLYFHRRRSSDCSMLTSAVSPIKSTNLLLLARDRLGQQIVAR